MTACGCAGGEAALHLGALCVASGCSRSLEADPAPAPLSRAQRRAQESRRIVEALEAVGWNRSRACQRLGMPRRTFYRRLREYGVL